MAKPDFFWRRGCACRRESRNRQLVMKSQPMAAVAPNLGQNLAGQGFRDGGLSFSEVRMLFCRSLQVKIKVAFRFWLKGYQSPDGFLLFSLKGWQSPVAFSVKLKGWQSPVPWPVLVQHCNHSPCRCPMCRDHREIPDITSYAAS